MPDENPDRRWLPANANQEVVGFIQELETCRPVGYRILVADYGIGIHIEGFGQATMQDGYGEEIYIEIQDGEVLVHVWDNINIQDPNTISMRLAAYAARKDQDA